MDQSVVRFAEQPSVFQFVTCIPIKINHMYILVLVTAGILCYKRIFKFIGDKKYAYFPSISDIF